MPFICFQNLKLKLSTFKIVSAYVSAHFKALIASKHIMFNNIDLYLNKSRPISK
jgi:hypothetical protein